MRISVGRKSGPLGKVIVVLALLFVAGGWLWATTHAPDAEAIAMHARCTHLPLLIGSQSSRQATGAWQREATYICLPDYAWQRLQHVVITQDSAPVRVVISQTWGPAGFAGILLVMGAFYLYARRSSRKTP